MEVPTVRLTANEDGDDECNQDYNPKDYYTDIEIERIRTLDVIYVIAYMNKYSTIQEVYDELNKIVSQVTDTTYRDVENIIKLSWNSSLLIQNEQVINGEMIYTYKFIVPSNTYNLNR